MEEKEINERTLRVKAEKEYLDIIIKEKTEQFFNEKEKNNLEFKQKNTLKKTEMEKIRNKDNILCSNNFFY